MNIFLLKQLPDGALGILQYFTIDVFTHCATNNYILGYIWFVNFRKFINKTLKATAPLV